MRGTVLVGQREMHVVSVAQQGPRGPAGPIGPAGVLGDEWGPA